MKTENRPIREAEINILWTGGFDSTFRLLYALLVENRRINLFYLYGPYRKTKDVEIKTMHKIIRTIRSAYPSVKENIGPLNIIDPATLVHDENVEKAYYSLKSKTHVGTQYRWLALFTAMHPEDDFEVLFIKQIKPGNNINSLISNNVTGKDHDCCLRKNLSDPELQIFSNFRFPTIHLTKVDMVTIARDLGFADILMQSWFCHKSRLGLIPCGTCKPCKIRMESGVKTGSVIVDLYFNLRKFLYSKTVK